MAKEKEGVMKGLFIGLIIGAGVMWLWFNTAGRVQVTDTVTVTNIVTETVRDTRIVEQVRYVTLTNYVTAPQPAQTAVPETDNPYAKYEIKRVEPDGITYVTASGLSKVYFPDLPKAVQAQYGYDPAKAKAYRDAQVSAAVERERLAVESATQKRVKDLEAWRQSQEYVRQVEARKAAEKAAREAAAVSNAAERAKQAETTSKVKSGFTGKIKLRH